MALQASVMLSPGRPLMCIGDVIILLRSTRDKVEVPRPSVVGPFPSPLVTACPVCQAAVFMVVMIFPAIVTLPRR